MTNGAGSFAFFGHESDVIGGLAIVSLAWPDGKRSIYGTGKVNR